MLELGFESTDTTQGVLNENLAFRFSPIWIVYSSYMFCSLSAAPCMPLNRFAFREELTAINVDLLP